MSKVVVDFKKYPELYTKLSVLGRKSFRTLSAVLLDLLQKEVVKVKLFNVTLSNVDTNFKIPIIRAVRNVLGLDLRLSKEIVDSVEDGKPYELVCNCSEIEQNEIYEMFKAEGVESFISMSEV